MSSSNTSEPTVFGVSVVRDEADVIAASACHQLAAGIDRLIVLDNGSTDSTPRILRRLARFLPLSWTRDDGPFHQGALLTGLVQEAARAGADWVVPFDADEFWQPRERRLKEVLGAARAGAMRVSMTHFVQRRDRRVSTPLGLLTMTMRSPRPAEAVSGMHAVRAGELSPVEIDWPPKLIVRPAAGLKLTHGAHGASGLDGPQEATPYVEVLHAMLRSRGQMDARAARGARLRPLRRGDESWHVVRLAGMDAAALDAEWRAGSYARDGTIDVHGARRALVYDDRLRRAAAPWVVPVRSLRARRILAASRRRARA